MGACRPGTPCQQIIDALRNPDAIQNFKEAQILVRDCPEVGTECLGIDGILQCMTGFTNHDVFVYKGDADAGAQTLTFTNTSGGTFVVNNSPALFADNDINVTGGTYDAGTGCITFTTSSGTTFDVCGFSSGSSFWSGETGNSVFPISPTNTKLGIGTPHPVNALDVVGIISASTHVYVADLQFNSSGYVVKGSDNRIFFPATDSTSTPNILYGYWGMPDNAHFYWGTGEDLDIYHSGSQGYIDNDTGNLNILSTNLYLGDSTSEVYAQDNLTVTDDLTVNGNTFYVDSANEKVGLKTLQPDAILAISGYTGGFQPYELGGGSVQFNNSFSRISFNDPATSSDVCVGGVLRFNDGEQVQTVTVQSISSSSTVILTETYEGESVSVTGSGLEQDCGGDELIMRAYDDDYLMFQLSGSSIYSGTTDLLDIFAKIGDINYINGNFWSGTTASAIFPVSPSNTKLGVGTSNPDKMFHVQTSDNTVAVFESTDNTCTIKIKDPTDEAFLIGKNGQLYISSQSGNPNANAAISFDYVNGRVGINNTAPTTALGVNGTISATTLFVGGPADFMHTPKIESDPFGDILELKTGTLYVNGTNTGIGTNTPREKLTVSGGDISGNTDIHAGVDLFVGNDGKVTGNLGIGIDPTSKLHVSTSNNVVAKIASTDSIATIELGDNSTSNQAVLTRVSNDLKICKDGGNVGIGATSPSEKLTVTGGDISGNTDIHAGIDLYVGNNIYSGTTNLGDLFAAAGSGGGGGSTYWSGTTGTNIIFPATVDVTQVGIGTSTPTGLFEVKDLIKFPEAGSVYVGDDAGANWESGSISNTAVGRLAMGTGTMSSAVQNTAFGFAAFAGVTTGDYNTAIGLQSLSTSDTGSWNTSVGKTTMYGATYHSYNVGVGANALYFTTSGSLGKTVAANTHNTAVGYSSQYYSLQGIYNTSVGSQTLGNGSVTLAGTGNTAMGYESMKNSQTGSYNTTMGYKAGNSITTGDYNICIGFGTEPTAATVDYEMNIGDIIYGNDEYSDAAISQIGIGYNNPKVKLDVHHNPTNLSNDTGGGEVITFGAEDGANNALAAGKVVHMDSTGTWKYADANIVASGASQMIGIALGGAVSDGILLRGFFDMATIDGAFVMGAPFYVSNDNAGRVDFTAPAAAGEYIRILGHATNTANVLYFNPDSTWVELS